MGDNDFYDLQQLAEQCLSPEIDHVFIESFQRKAESDKRDITQTISLERIVEMLDDSSQKQDKRYESDRMIIIVTLVASVVAAVAAVIAVLK